MVGGPQTLMDILGLPQFTLMWFRNNFIKLVKLQRCKTGVKGKTGLLVSSLGAKMLLVYISSCDKDLFLNRLDLFSAIQSCMHRSGHSWLIQQYLEFHYHVRHTEHRNVD